ncbi:beta-1,4-N-acetylgalactosaminyltransferase 3 isoform X2 [Heptranchias perlo]|uniref:beta-1,4-N-acetylgalactosaminyltransferase 3 isoform X2 n=1 Tax=Heptranchias perlo TaxID=212740 RepID=UPI00355A9D41
MMLLFPIKKIRKHFKVLVFVVILGLGVWAAYLEFVASSEWRRSGAFKPHREFRNWKKQSHVQRNKVLGVDRDLEYYNQRKEEAMNEDPESNHLQLNDKLSFAEVWKPEFMGQANLHIFEDWCGGSVDQLRKNIHFPLFPHTRTVVKKLAVAPRWTNYALRIFGYIHPYADSVFQFAVASDDNSEFWLSTNDNPSNVTLLARVGKTGKEWTAPGEFGKFQSQVSKPTQLLSSRKYYFEVLHKQNAQGTDHVEVAWRLHSTGLKFSIIDSQYISLYNNESLIKLNEVQHIPQSVASHKKNYGYTRPHRDHPAEMLKHDPRDSFFQLPLIDESRVHQVLPECVYRPSYIIKGFPLLRYQGLQFVHLTYVYPNDYTRLTHMESENKCFYYENAYYLDRFGFYRYMKMDTPQKPDKEKNENPFWIGAGKPNKQNGNKEEGLGANPEVEEEEYDYEEEDQFPQPEDPKAAFQEQNQKNIAEVGSKKKQASSIQEAKHFANSHGREQEVTVKDYGDDYDDYAFKRRRKLFYAVENKPSDNAFVLNKTVDSRLTERALAPKGMKGRNNETDSVEENAQSTHSLSQKTAKTSHSFSKQKYTTSDHRLERQSAKSFVRQKAKENNIVSRDIFPGENLDINKNIGRLQFSERQTNGLVEKQGEMVVQKPKRTIYAQQPPILSGSDKMNRNNGTFQNKKDSKRRTDLLRNRKELESQSKLKEEVLHAEKQIKSSNKSVRGQSNEMYNGAENPGPTIPMYFLSMKEVQPIKVKEQSDKIRSLVNEEGGEKDYDYTEQKNVAVFGRSKGKNKEKLKEYEKKGEKWGRISSMDTVTNSKLTMEEEDEEEMPEDMTSYLHAYDKAVSWEQTFTVNNMDFHALRSDWIDLRCNVSGNLLMKDQEALDVVEMYMRKLNEKHKGIYTLHQIVSIEKRLDRVHGSRYLLELELLMNKKTIVRLSEYIYSLNRNGYYMDGDDERKMRNIFRHRGRQLRENQEKMMLCTPTGFTWQRNAVVHFIVPVKNQARWVQQFIFDMEELYRATGDEYFNVIITDYSSTDMDVEKAMKHSMLTRYQYVKLEGNFERSAGLQAGIDLIKDDHSIVFLCDLHIYFPPSIIDSIRKHCVEGKMAFAPIVMRLNCGSSPQEPDGYWEMNGFGLLGIYKSDLDSIGGMNTKEFRDHWGGEDWELLDRIFQAGLEVERLYMRNFFHYYHSKRGMWNRKQVKVT